jgi:hypothetical protein
MSKKEIKPEKIISHTCFPCGHRINWWSEVPFEMSLGRTIYGTIDFGFYRLSQDRMVKEIKEHE